MMLGLVEPDGVSLLQGSVVGGNQLESAISLSVFVSVFYLTCNHPPRSLSLLRLTKPPLVNQLLVEQLPVNYSGILEPLG